MGNSVYGIIYWQNCLSDSTNSVHAGRDGGVYRGRPPPRLSGSGLRARRQGLRHCRHQRVSPADQEVTIHFQDDEVCQEEAKSVLLMSNNPLKITG